MLIRIVLSNGVARKRKRLRSVRLGLNLVTLICKNRFIDSKNIKYRELLI